MSVLEWNKAGEKIYNVGTDKGVLYKQVNGAYPLGVAWNGLTKVSENPEGAEPQEFFADNVKWITLRTAEKYKATLEAFMYPKEFKECDGSAELIPGLTVGQQTRKPFGFSYRTLKGNDTQREDYGYVIHCVYGCTANPTSKEHGTINENIDLNPFSWELSADPVKLTGNLKPTATVEIDSTEYTPEQMQAIEDVLWGTENTDARLPLPNEIATILTEANPSG